MRYSSSFIQTLTVGSGISPDQLLPARGLFITSNKFTTGREFDKQNLSHPAPKKFLI